jgi:hypothetical protein
VLGAEFLGLVQHRHHVVLNRRRLVGIVVHRKATSPRYSGRDKREMPRE